MNQALELPKEILGQRPLADIRSDFPILLESVRGKPLVYLDNAATTQKPQVVLDTLVDYYKATNSNVHRGVHLLSERATTSYEGARETVRAFLNARETREIVFVRGTTEAINLVAQSFARPRFQPGDEILITEMEHHSNIVPWQMVCQQTGAVLKVVPVDDRGVLRMDQFQELLGPRTRLVAVTHVSNALGTVNPVKEIIDLAHDKGVPVLVDGAQGVAHQAVDVQALDCDFYAFSGHKLYGPTGIGALYAKAEHLEAMQPWQGGGDMIRYVTFEKTEYNDIPYKFEAGTPDIAGAIGLAAAIDYVQGIGLDAINRHEQHLLGYATARAAEIPGLRIIGTAPEKAGVLSFVLDGVHPHDIGTILDMEGVAIRTGHHCAMPVMERYDIPATARASFGLYNSLAEIDALMEGLHKVRKWFKR